MHKTSPYYNLDIYYMKRVNENHKISRLATLVHFEDADDTKLRTRWVCPQSSSALLRLAKKPRRSSSRSWWVCNCSHMLDVDNITERQQQHNPNWRASALGHSSDHHMSHVHPNIYNRNWKYWQIFHIKLFSSCFMFRCRYLDT